MQNATREATRYAAGQKANRGVAESHSCCMVFVICATVLAKSRLLVGMQLHSHPQNRSFGHRFTAGGMGVLVESRFGEVSSYARALRRPATISTLLYIADSRG